MSDKIISIDAKHKQNIIKFNPPVLCDDGYIRLSCFNALDKAGYEVSPDGVKAFQLDMDIEITGEMNIETITFLIQVFDNDKIQDILTHLDKEMNYHRTSLENKKKEANKTTTSGQIKAIIWLAATLFFLVYGICTFAINLIHLIF